jgi:RNA polymerase sigma-70 factor (ECF subfamily)
MLDTEMRADEFELHRPHLRGVAYRMLGSLDEADDVVQQAWLRAAGADLSAVANLGGWLTTVTSRICLDLLRSRRRRGERPLTPAADEAAAHGPHAHAPAVDPSAEAELAESVGLALLVVLDRLSPAERVAFVLHDLFAMPFEEIADVVGRTPGTTKKLASRARSRVRGPSPDHARADLERDRTIVEAFRRAAAGGDLDQLLHLLAPDVVRRIDPVLAPLRPARMQGALAVAEETTRFGGGARWGAVALVDGRPGLVVAPSGRLRVVLRMTIADGLITAYEVIGDPAALAAVDLTVC